jgi:hypothetical protein
MKPEVHEAIRNNIRLLSNNIHSIKEEASHTKIGYISPSSVEEWSKYIGMKKEATKWLIALHIHKGSHEKVKAHVPKAYPEVVKLASKALVDLEEKINKELKHEVIRVSA